MGKYAEDHAGALSDVAEAGAPVAFTGTTRGTYNELTDQETGGGTSTVTGYAIRVRGNPILYQTLNLVESEAPTLLFVPDVEGQLPALNAYVTFGGVVYEVRDVLPTAPDGVAILARVVVSR